jgi:pimeloyl-ACP methyl ester carboxylesterase
MWDKVVPQLEDRFRVIRFDVRGTGQSTPSPEEEYTFETYFQDAITILAHFGYEDSIVWSMAWGSRAAVAYAAHHPERVQLLALYDASVGRADVEAQAEGREKAFKAQQEAGMPLIERPEGWNNNLNPTEMRKALRAASKIKNLPGLVPKIEAPTLVCTGDHDPNLASSRRIAEGIPNARLEVMENVGHGSVLQRPDLTTEIFLKFVEENKDTIE